MKIPKNILITGASSGLGSALALEYAKPGVILHLSGRDEKRLGNIAAKCRAQGAEAYVKIIDVTDTQAMQDYIQQADTISPLDLLIANAGISAGTGGATEGDEQVRKIFATNIDGVINSIQPAIPLMLARKSGQIAIISSLAGIRALPSSPAYSASKACVRYYGEALRGNLIKHNIYVSVICPGYIMTPMTDINNFPMPFLMTAQKAAQTITRGLERGRSRIAFPRRLFIPLWWLSCLSPIITDFIFARLPAKPAANKDKF